MSEAWALPAPPAISIPRLPNSPSLAQLHVAGCRSTRHARHQLRARAHSSDRRQGLLALRDIFACARSAPIILHFGRLSAESAREAPTAQKWPDSRFFAQVASAPSAPSASQAPWTTPPPTSRCQACCSAGRLQIPGENLHALRRPSRWFGSLDDQKAVGRRRPVGLMVGRVRGSTPRGGTAGGPLGSSVVGSASCSCRGLLVCVGEQPTARRAPRIAPACFPRVPPAPPSPPPAPPPSPPHLPSFLAVFCLLTVDFLLLFMVAQGASPAPVPVPPTLALPSR